MGNWQVNTQPFSPSTEADIADALDAAVAQYDADNAGHSNGDQIGRARDDGLAEGPAQLGNGGGMVILMAGFTAERSSSMSVTVQPAEVGSSEAQGAQLRARAAAQDTAGGDVMEAANPNEGAQVPAESAGDSQQAKEAAVAVDDADTTTSSGTAKKSPSKRTASRSKATGKAASTDV
jgi:hypothetical protein